MKHAALIHYLEAAAVGLTDRVLLEMYKDPFWYARYGERADRHGRQDGMFHIKYLVTALDGDDKSVMVHYARWLQQLLTTRGMCTRHLDDNFRLLAEAIGADGPPDFEAAVAMLDAARGGLLYPEGPARTIQELAPELASRIARKLSAQWSVADEVATLLSYVADAVALGDPAQFRAHVAWTGDFLDKQGTPRARLTDSLAAVRAELASELPPETLAALFD